MRNNRHCIEQYPQSLREAESRGVPGENGGWEFHVGIHRPGDAAMSSLGWPQEDRFGVWLSIVARVTALQV